MSLADHSTAQETHAVANLAGKNETVFILVARLSAVENTVKPSALISFTINKHLFFNLWNHPDPTAHLALIGFDFRQK